MPDRHRHGARFESLAVFATVLRSPSILRVQLAFLLFNTTELAAWIRDGAHDPERVRAFARESFEIADGHASERLVDRVILPALRHEAIHPDARAPGTA